MENTTIILKIISTPAKNYNWWYQMWLEQAEEKKRQQSLVITPTIYN